MTAQQQHVAPPPFAPRGAQPPLAPLLPPRSPLSRCFMHADECVDAAIWSTSRRSRRRGSRWQRRRGTWHLSVHLPRPRKLTVQLPYHVGGCAGFGSCVHACVCVCVRVRVGSTAHTYTSTPGASGEIAAVAPHAPARFRMRILHQAPQSSACAAHGDHKGEHACGTLLQGSGFRV